MKTVYFIKYGPHNFRQFSFLFWKINTKMSSRKRRRYIVQEVIAELECDSDSGEDDLYPSSESEEDNDDSSESEMGTFVPQNSNESGWGTDSPPESDSESINNSDSDHAAGQPEISRGKYYFIVLT